MRTSLTLLVVAGAVIGLAGCSAATPTPTAKPVGATCLNAPSGSTSKSVTVSGAFRSTPVVKFSTPLKATSVERTVVTMGTGAKAAAGSTVDVALAAFNGTTGKQLTSTGFDGTSTTPITVDDTKYVPGLVRTIECEPTGSRIVATASVKDAFGKASPTSLGLKATDSVVFVADIVDVLPTRADGTPVTPPAGLPTVKLASSGQPTVTIPKTQPPATTTLAVLKQGSGETVLPGDTVTVQYQGTIWRTGKVFDQSWGRGATTFQTTGVVPGFRKALEGQKVGSQVIAIVPPTDGYGAQGNGDIKGTDTMVFVVDILKTTR